MATTKKATVRDNITPRPPQPSPTFPPAGINPATGRPFETVRLPDGESNPNT